MRLSSLLIVVALAAGSALVSRPVSVAAHHPFAAVYDSTRTVQVRGVITRLEWRSPHAKVYVDAKGANGQIVNWLVEIQAPPVLASLGWQREWFVVGAPITVEAHPARNGNPAAQARTIVDAQGRRLVLER